LLKYDAPENPARKTLRWGRGKKLKKKNRIKNNNNMSPAVRPDTTDDRPSIRRRSPARGTAS